MIDKLRVFFNVFQAHIVEISNTKALRDKYVVCDDPKKRHALFSRARVWTFHLLVIAIISCFKRTLSIEIMEFLEREKLPQTTPEAYIKRRGFISAELFRDLNTWLVSTSLQQRFFKKWHGGKYLCAIDGTRLSLPYTPGLYKKYRQRTDKSYNLARGVFITDPINRTILQADIVPNKTEERKAALELISRNEFPYDIQSSVFVMDRGYPSLRLMNWFHNNTGGFIIRARRDTSPKVAEFMDSDRMEATVILQLSKNRRDIDYPRPEPLSVRLIKRQPLADEEEPVVFITDINYDIFPAEVIIEAYRLRWNIETEIGTEKNELQIEIFSGLRDICIRQDFFAAIIMYNLEALIRLPLNKKLEAKTDGQVYQVDMNCTWALMCTLIEALYKPKTGLDRELTACVKFFLKVMSIKRPGRSSPHDKMTIKARGKYITMTNYKRAL